MAVVLVLPWSPAEAPARGCTVCRSARLVGRADTGSGPVVSPSWGTAECPGRVLVGAGT